MVDLVWPVGSIGISGLIVLLGVIILVIRLKEKRAGTPSQDERTQKINGKAAFYALHIGLYFMVAILAVLIIGREFFNMPDLSAGPVVVASMIVFGLSDIGLHWYFSKKDDF